MIIKQLVIINWNLVLLEILKEFEKMKKYYKDRINKMFALYTALQEVLRNACSR